MIMDIRAAIDRLDRVLTDTAAVRAALTAALPTTRVVRAGENLQAALDAGGDIQLEAGAAFEGHFHARVPGTRLRGPNAALRGSTGPALMIPPSASDIVVEDLDASSGHTEVLTIGENTDRQTSAADAPASIRLARVRIHTHRGKRAFAVHGQDVTLEDCEALDVWDPGGQDSQAIYIGNSPRGVRIIGGRYSAGSEVILVGGDRMRIPGLIPQQILVEGAELFRPLAWQTDGVRRKVKNIVELKSGEHVTIRRNRLSGCWRDGQDGWAFVLTPKDNNQVRYVTLEENDVRDVAGIIQAIGRDYNSVTPEALTGLEVSRNVLVANRALYGGFGQLLRVGAEPGTLTFADNVYIGDGSSTVYYFRGTVMEPTGVRRGGGSIGRLALAGNICQLGTYGLNLDGQANARDWQLAVDDLAVQGNTFGGPTTMRNRLPDNTYLALDAWRALPEVQAALGGPAAA